MSAHRLDNYLVMYRKRAGFSQDEVAYLLGAKSGSMNCRYERFKRKPSLETALAYEAIYGVPARELFAGVAQKAEHVVKQRARTLDKRLRTAGRRPLSRTVSPLPRHASAHSGILCFVRHARRNDRETSAPKRGGRENGSGRG